VYGSAARDSGMMDPLDYDIPRGVDALIRRAIARKRLIRCVLDGRERIGEPHDFGIRDGRAKLFLWQVRGASRQGRLPGWRTLRFPETHDFVILEERFPGRRGPASGRHRRWDEVWARVEPPEPMLDRVAKPPSPRRASASSPGRRAARRRP
jgi:hypothetical protein